MNKFVAVPHWGLAATEHKESATSRKQLLGSRVDKLVLSRPAYAHLNLCSYYSLVVASWMHSNLDLDGGTAWRISGIYFDLIGPVALHHLVAAHVSRA